MRAALERLTKAVGSGATVPAHAYVTRTEEGLFVTDGRQFAYDNSAGGPEVPSFCVKHDALLRAMSRDGASLAVNAAGDVVIRYAGERGRLTLKSIDINSVPRMPTQPESNWLDLNGAAFVETIKFLRKFCGSPDGQAWSTGIHFGPDFAFAASNQYFARRDVSYLGDNVVSLPPWAADFVLSLSVAPFAIAIDNNALFLNWGPVILRTTYLSEEAPDSAWSIATNVPLLRSEQAIPLGMQETLERAREEGLTTIHIGGGRAHAALEYGEFEESVNVATDARRWNTAYLLMALEYATTIDLSGNHAFWNGVGCRGMIAGMVG